MGAVPAEGEEVIVSRIQRLAPWLIGLVGAVFAVSADAQNIDAGKSAAQIFSDTCSSCHRNARELKRTGTGFLRSHYTTGQEEAAAMASYLAGIASDPRAGQQKRLPGVAPGEAAKQPPRQQSPAEQAKGAPGQALSKGAQASRRPAANAVTAAAPEENPPEPAPAPAPMKPVPVLEPFEE
jgi:hypothetical protein